MSAACHAIHSSPTFTVALQSMLNGESTGHAKALVLVTDGALGDFSSSNAAATIAKDAGISFVTVGVGSIVEAQLVALASKPELFIRANNFKPEELQSPIDSAAIACCVLSWKVNSLCTPEDCSDSAPGVRLLPTYSAPLLQQPCKTAASIGHLARCQLFLYTGKKQISICEDEAVCYAEVDVAGHKSWVVDHACQTGDSSIGMPENTNCPGEPWLCAQTHAWAS